MLTNNFIMNFKNYTKSLITKILLTIIFFSLTTSCGIYRKTDTREVPVNIDDRVQKNIQEGKSFRLMDLNKDKNTGTFSFATSNEMWRASIDLLDFVPLTNVDYSGGIIITEWFAGENINNESVKITIKFLSDEIRADGLDVVIHKKNCSTNQNCSVEKLTTDLSNEIKSEILKRATLIKKNIPNPNSDYKIKRFK